MVAIFYTLVVGTQLFTSNSSPVLSSYDDTAYEIFEINIHDLPIDET